MGRRFTSADFAHLETIRGIAALYVVIHHARGFLWSGFVHLRERGVELPVWQKPGAYLNLLTILGHEAVIVFFVLSGFSIAHSLRSNPAAPGFLSRRFVRLYPPYLVSLLYAAVVVYLVVLFAPDWIGAPDRGPSFAALASPKARFLDWSANLRMLLYVDRNELTPQYWSLIYEWIFYLLAPLLVRRWRLFLAGSVVALVTGQLLGLRRSDSILGEFVLHYGWMFAVGVALYNRYDRVAAVLVRLRKGTLFTLCTVLVTAMVALRVGRPHTLATEALAALVGVLTMVLFLEFDLKLRWFPALGEFSYSLYLTHTASMFLTALLLGQLFGVHTPITNPYLWGTGVVVSLAVAYLLFLIAERPSRMLLRTMRQSRVSVNDEATGGTPRAAG